MRLGLLLTTLIGLAGASHISSAADATWAAVGALENGVSTSCGGGSIPLPEWTSPAYGQVDIKGNTLTEFRTMTFDPGSGARPFHMTYRLKACRRVYTPRA